MLLFNFASNPLEQLHTRIKHRQIIAVKFYIKRGMKHCASFKGKVHLQDFITNLNY